MNRQRLIKLFTFLGGLYFFVEYLLPEKIGDFQFSRYNDQITQGLMAVTAMTFGLGLINILYIHGTKVALLRKGWLNSVGLLIGLAAMLVVTTREWRASYRISAEVKMISVAAEFAAAIAADSAAGIVDIEKTKARIEVLKTDSHAKLDAIPLQLDLPENISAADREQYSRISSALAEAIRASLVGLEGVATPSTDAGASLASVAQQIRSVAQLQQERSQHLYRYSFDYSLYQLLYEGFFIALGSAMFALLGFYMAAAAYRAFRVRSFESALMMTAAVIVMLGQIPFGLWIWDGFTDLRLWLLSTPSTAAFRAVKFGAAVAGLVMAFRMWLSIETDSFSDRRET